MRALCGSIITAGAFFALGLTMIGIGTRYSTQTTPAASGDIVWLKLGQIDTALMIGLVVSLAGVVIGLGTAFVGLAFHHERRHREWLHLRGHQPDLHTGGVGHDHGGAHSTM